MIDFSIEKCLKAKKILGKDTAASYIWRTGFAPSNHIGNCTNLYRRHNPETCEEFFTKYVTFAKENPELAIKERGLSEAELLDLAEKYRAKTEATGRISGIDTETYLYDALCHIIVETWDGQKIERDFRNFLEHSLPYGYECGTVGGSADGKYGIDILVKRSDGKMSAIQIKPITFFKSKRYDVRCDRVNLCRKYIMTLSDYSLKTYYAIYQKDRNTGEVRWLKNRDGKFRFKIDDLFVFDPSDIDGTFVEKKLPDVFTALRQPPAKTHEGG